ncbi:MAG: hypothetical protein JWM11_7271 [Planctomycetaceae bacterium]|nr:hypothetical protein [Planctomycetaceae bacterium]
MKIWSCPAFDQRAFPPVQTHLRLVLITTWVVFLLGINLQQGFAQFVAPQDRPRSVANSADNEAGKGRPPSIKLRYVPPVHQVPAKRSGLRPVSQNAIDISVNSGSHLLDPQFDEFPVQSTLPLKWVAGRQLTGGIQNAQNGPFLAAPRFGPDPPESDFSQEVYLDAPPIGADQSGADADFGRRGPFQGRSKSPIPPDYWIISTRKCAQSTSPCDADACTEYYYRGPSGQVEPRTAEDFYRSLNPAVPVCFMIHGSLTEWSQNIREGHSTYEWLKRAAPETPFQLVLFTWPSERAVTLMPPIDFSVLGRRSSFNGLYLARVLSRMPPSTCVSLIGHSHGARLAVTALHLMSGGDAYGFRLMSRQTAGPRIRTVLAAAAMDHQWLDPGQRYDKALQSTESLVNLRNQTDFPLILYPFPMLLGHDSLGRAGFSWYDRYSLGADYNKIRNVEVTFLLGIRHIWPQFHAHPEIAQTLAPYVFFQQDVPAQSTVMRQHAGWWPSSSQEISVRSPSFPAHRPNTLGKSTLARGVSNSAESRSFEDDREISLEQGRGWPAPTAIRVFPRALRSSKFS